MPAVVAVNQATGAGPTYDVVDDGINPLRFCNADTHDPGLVTPCVISPNGIGNYTYSFWVHLFLDLSGTYSRINNVRFYSDGTIGWTLGTAGELRVGLRNSGDNGVATGGYDQATGSASTGHDMEDDTDGHTYYKTQAPETATVKNYTSGSPLTVDSVNHDGVAEKTKGVVLQCKVDGDATRGEQADETLTFMWDEI